MSGMIDQLLLEAPKVHQYAQSRKGLVPQNRKSRAELIRAHLMGQIVETSAQSAIHIEAYFLPPPYPPSVSPLALLKKVMIKDLLLETHHTGSYVLLRTATGPRSTSGIHFVVEDETEDCILLSLYHQSKSQPGKITLEQGQICIVKEPYLVAMSEDGIKIRVDHLSDIISVNPFDDKVPQKWRCSKTNSTASADTWRARGKDFYKQSKYQFAIEWYVPFEARFSTSHPLTHSLPRQSFQWAAMLSDR